MSLTLDSLLSEQETASALGVSVPTLRRWRQLRIGPAYVKLGRRVVYCPNDLLNHVKSQRVEPARRSTAVR